MSNDVTKQELIVKLADTNNITLKQSREFLESFQSIVTEYLLNGQNVRLVGFGAFLCSSTKERTGRNPITGDKITVRAHNKVSFKVGSLLKKAIYATEVK